jgi:DNA-binding PadR family transcriptional regulator
MIDRDFIRGFIKLYAFSLAADGEPYGLKILEEMNQHGFSLSPGTLYPALHALLREGDVTMHQRNGRRKKYSSFTCLQQKGGEN